MRNIGSKNRFTLYITTLIIFQRRLYNASFKREFSVPHATIKSEFTSPEIYLRRDPDRMSAVEMISARNELLHVLFDKGVTPHENHHEKERYSYPRVQFWTSKTESDDTLRDDAEAGELPDKIAYLEDMKGKMIDIKRVLKAIHPASL
jgi:hypothetical protein